MGAGDHRAEASPRYAPVAAPSLTLTRGRKVLPILASPNVDTSVRLQVFEALRLTEANFWAGYIYPIRQHVNLSQDAVRDDLSRSIFAPI